MIRRGIKFALIVNILTISAEAIKIAYVKDGAW